MLRRVSCANSLEVSQRSSHRVEEADSEERSISCSVVIPQLLRVSSYSMFTRLLQEVFILLVKVVQLLVLLSMLLKIQKLEN
jgi:hypothetical protein